MDHFNIFSTIIAGIIATAIMNIFLFLFGLLTRTNLRLITLIGTLVTKETGKNRKLSRSRKSFLTGVLIYYALGVLIAIMYAVLWHFGVGGPNVVNIFIFGFFAGLLALLGLNISLKFHPDPPAVRLADYFSPVLIGHVIHAINFLYFYIYFV